jgi:hypothetical protein
MEKNKISLKKNPEIHEMVQDLKYLYSVIGSGYNTEEDDKYMLQRATEINSKLLGIILGFKI